MKICTQEERGLLHSANSAEYFFESPAVQATSATAPSTHHRQLAAEAAGLRKKLADVYPELARVQRLYG